MDSHFNGRSLPHLHPYTHEWTKTIVAPIMTQPLDRRSPRGVR